MTLLAYIASFAGISMGLSSLPQVYKIYKRKSAADISVTTHLIIVIGAFIWLLYGLEIKSFPIILSNFIGILTNSLIIIGCFNYK
jgi:MtN3 and saliva related transmembrane protein